MMMNRAYIVALAVVTGCEAPDGTSTKAGEDAGGSDAGGSSDTAPPPQFLSCAGLAATFGARGNDSCCHSLDVSSGSYDRS